MVRVGHCWCSGSCAPLASRSSKHARDRFLRHRALPAIVSTATIGGLTSERRRSQASRMGGKSLSRCQTSRAKCAKCFTRDSNVRTCSGVVLDAPCSDSDVDRISRRLFNADTALKLIPMPSTITLTAYCRRARSRFQAKCPHTLAPSNNTSLGHLHRSDLIGRGMRYGASVLEDGGNAPLNEATKLSSDARAPRSPAASTRNDDVEDSLAGLVHGAAIDGRGLRFAIWRPMTRPALRAHRPPCSTIRLQGCIGAVEGRQTCMHPPVLAAEADLVEAVM